jgi:hypothetical protein
LFIGYVLGGVFTLVDTVPAGFAVGRYETITVTLSPTAITASISAFGESVSADVTESAPLRTATGFGLYAYTTGGYSAGGTFDTLSVDSNDPIEPSEGAYSSSSVNADGLFGVLVFDAPSPNDWAATRTEDITKRPVITVDSPDPEGGPAVTRTIRIMRLVSTSIVSTKLHAVVAFEFPIYDADDEGTPVLTVPAGWISDSDGNTTLSATAQTVTNTSTLPFPNCTGTDVFIHPEWSTFSGPFGDPDLDLPFGVSPHCHHGCKAVILTFTPSSGPPVVERLTIPTTITKTKALVGLAALDIQAISTYLPTTNAADLATGLVTVTTQVVPRIGTAASIRTYTTEVFAGPQLADAVYVDAVDGNDANDGLSYAQRVKKMERAGAIIDAATRHIIKFSAGTYSAADGIGSDGFVNDRPVVFALDTDHGATQDNVILQFNTQPIQIARIRLEGITLDVRQDNELTMWTGGPLGAASRSIQYVGIKVITSNADGRDGTEIGSMHSNVNGRVEAFNSRVYDFPGRSFPDCYRRVNCTSEKVSTDGLRDCAHTYMDLLYDLTNILGGHPDYLQNLSWNECVVDSASVYKVAGEPLFLAPSSAVQTGYRFWLCNILIAETNNDSLKAQVAARDEVVTLGPSMWANVTLPNANVNLTNINPEGTGSITHSNTWFIGNTQRRLENLPAGVLAHSCHSVDVTATNDTDYGFTQGDPMFVDGAYDTDYDGDAIDYRPADGSPLLAAAPRIQTIDLEGNPRASMTAIGAYSARFETGVEYDGITSPYTFTGLLPGHNYRVKLLGTQDSETVESDWLYFTTDDAVVVVSSSDSTLRNRPRPGSLRFRRPLDRIGA